MSGWTSPTLARLTSADSEIPLNPEQASWVASLVNMGRFFGAIIGAITTSLFGTKRSIFITLFPLAVGWLIIAVANSVVLLYIARLFSGLGLGMAFSTFPLYIGEVSMPEIRGALISLATCGGPFGQIISSICGSYFSISTSSFIYFGLCILLMGVFLWLPESPHHLAKIGDREGARKSIEWYRAGTGVDTELDAVEKFVVSNSTQSLTDKFKEFQNWPIKKATFQIIALFTFMQICGLNSVIFYMEIILKRAKSTIIKPSEVVIYDNVLGTIAAAISIFLIDRCGRRFLLLISSVGVTISMLSMMIHFWIIDMGLDTSNLQWLPISAMFLYIIAFCIGMMPVPSTVLSEIFPANIKCIAACISGLTGATMAFISTKTYQPLVDTLGEKYVFMIYALCSVIVIPYVIFIMPETKGKSLQQIQDELIKK